MEGESSVKERISELMKQARALQAAITGWSAPSPEGKSRQEALTDSLRQLLDELAGAEQSPAKEALARWNARLQVLQAEFQELLMPRRTAVQAVIGLSGMTMLLFLLGVGLHTFLLQQQEGARNISPEDRVAILMGMSAVAALWGALGSTTTALVTVSRLYADGMLTFNDLVDQFTKPLRGAFVGGIIFLLIQGGLLTMDVDGRPLAEQQSFVIFALAGLSGLYEHGFMEKARELLGALLGTANSKHNGSL